MQAPGHGELTLVRRILFAILGLLQLIAVLQLGQQLVTDSLLQLLLDREIGQRQPVNHGRINLLRVEWPVRQTLHHQRTHLVPQPPLAIVLLDNLQEPRIVEIAIPLELIELICNPIQFRLKLLEGLRRSIAAWGRVLLLLLFLFLLLLIRPILILAIRGACWLGQPLQLLKSGIGALAQLAKLGFVERGDLAKLDIEDFVAEARLVVFGPRAILHAIVILAQHALELGIVEVVVLPCLVLGRREGFAEAHGGRESRESRGCVGLGSAERN